MSLPLGNVPTWIAAVGTVGALWVAALQIRTERNHRIAQEANDRLERHQAQARLIAAMMPSVAKGLCRSTTLTSRSALPRFHDQGQ
jgi:hypothetical protein